MARLPIKFEEHLQLSKLGINPTSVNFNSLTMESDKFICVRDQNGDATQVVIIDLRDAAHPIKRPISADSAVMHPTDKIIALRGKVGPSEQKTLQIFNIDDKVKIKSHTMNEDVVFWKWINNASLGVVTENAVYHWEMSGDSVPAKMFDRLPNLNGFQIIQYRTDAQQKWLLLIGISAQPQNIVGMMQLYSVDRKCSQIIEGHVASFAEFKLNDNQNLTSLLCFALRNSSGGKLHIVEIGQPPANNAPYVKKTVEIPFPVDAKDDFPIAMQISQKYRIVYIISKYGFIYMYDIESGKSIYTNRISDDAIFVTAQLENTGGIIGVNRKGQVLSVTLDEDNVIPYIIETLADHDFALRFASLNDLSGAEELFRDKFDNLYREGDYSEAAKIAATAPKKVLRTPEVLQKLLKLPQAAPFLRYFGALLENGQLTKYESLELSRVVMEQGKKQLIEKWLLDEKLDCSEELGDFVKTRDPTLALSIYLRADIHDKVLLGFAESENFRKVIPYAKKVNFEPNYVVLLRAVSRANKENASEFAVSLVRDSENPPNLNSLVDVFMEQNLVQQCTAFLLEVLKQNRPEESELQTRLLEINLKTAPQVADAILGNEMFTHFDKNRVAQLCEEHGLFHRALEHYVDMDDIKRLIVQTHLFNLDWLIGYFGKLSCVDSISCLKAMLSADISQNLQTCVRITTKYWEQLTIASCVELYDIFSSYEGHFYFLSAIIAHTEEPEHHFKYIESACKIGQIKEVERFCRDSNFYDGEKVKNFFKEINLTDQKPMMIVCDRFDFIDDLVSYLHVNSLDKHIETFVHKVNATRLPKVVGKLVDLSFSDETVQNLILSTSGEFSYGELVEALENRGRLKLMLPWLQRMVQNGKEEPEIHNALAKLYIDSDNAVDKFLLENKHYESHVVGKYCEKRNPHLACLAYERGQCDMELIRVCNENGLFKTEARYLVKRKDPELWTKILDESNPHKKTVVDQIVNYVSVESPELEEVTATVKAFMTANLPNELVELLERLILNGSIFTENRNLQNLLILTAIKTDKSKVMNYVTQLNNYDVTDIGNIAVDNGLFEEAFFMYKKFDDNVSAIQILLKHKMSLAEAENFAERCDQPAVWSELGRAQLRRNSVKDAIASFVKAQDMTEYLEVVRKAEEANAWEESAKYLRIARTKIKDTFVDSELVYALARIGRLHEMEDFIITPNCADILKIGDKCRDANLLEAAKILYGRISNFASLSTTLIRLGDFQNAVDCAKKTQNSKTLKEVCYACLEHHEFRLAHTCGILIAVDADELGDLIQHYEDGGYFAELTLVLEGALSMERAHMGIFTELAILYTKHDPCKLKERLDLFSQHINIPKVIRATKAAHLWEETVFLYDKYEDYDNAIVIMMEHPTKAWKETLFKELIIRVANLELIYKAVNFYLEYKPHLLNEVLLTVITRLDLNRIVNFFTTTNQLRLIKKFLTTAQSSNNRMINEALNGLFIEENDYDALKLSIVEFDNFDDLQLAQILQNHILIEFRRIAAYLCRKNNKWKQCLDICKENALYSEAIDYAAASQDVEIIVNLMNWFLERRNHDFFVITLFLCYDLICPDVVLELAWKYKVLDLAMPYLIQVVREYGDKINRLEEELNKRGKKDHKRRVENSNGENVLYLMDSQSVPCWPSSCSFKCAMSSRKDQMQ